MDTLEPKDESYWRDRDGSVNAEGHELANIYRTKFAKSNPRIRKDGQCSCCFDKEENKGRPLRKVAETSRQKLDIWLCEVCDADAFNIVTSK